SVVGESLVQRRLSTVLLGIFGLIALLVASAGLYGVMAYFVAQRTRELGIRLAIGAAPSNVLGLMLLEGMLTVIIGLFFALVGAFGLTRLMARLLFDVTPTDPFVLFAVSAILIRCALVALVIPARRSTLVDP